MALSTDRLTAETERVEELMYDLTVCGGDDVSNASDYHLSAGGSRVRCKLALDAGWKLGLDLQTRRHLAAACELLHNASLVHDDMQDGDRRRRGRDSVWARYSRDTALLTGDLFISAAYAALAAIEHPRLPALCRQMHLATSTVIRGQAFDLSAESRGPLTISAYRAIAIGKSGSLLSLPIELCLLAAQQEGFIELAQRAANAFAIAYQMSDDISDQAIDRNAGRPNIVNAVRSFEGALGKPAIDEASHLAFESFDLSIELAAKLPSGSGELLIEYAGTMQTAPVTEMAA